MQNFKKMNLLLMSSSRVHGYAYLEHAKEQITSFLNKNNVRTILFVPYALPGHDKYTCTLSTVLAPWGYKVEGLHTKEYPLEAVRKAEAIFVGGGNTFVLLKALYELRLVDEIRESVLRRGIPYIGSSAGTNVATTSIHTTNDMPVAYPPTFDALNLVPFNINPHYIDADPTTKHKGETREERLEEFVEYHKRPVLGLREGTCILIEDETATLLGDRNARLFQCGHDPMELEPNADLSFLLNRDAEGKKEDEESDIELQ